MPEKQTVCFFSRIFIIRLSHFFF